MNGKLLTILTTAGITAFVAGDYIYLLPLYLDNRVQNYLGTLPQTQADQIDTNTLAGTIKLSNVNSFSNGTPVSIDSITVHASPISVLYASLTGNSIAADVSLTNLTGAAGTENFSVPSATITQAQFDTPADQSTDAAIQAVSAASINLPQVIYRAEAGTANTTVVVSGISARNISHGVAGSIVADSFQISRTVSAPVAMATRVQFQDFAVNNLNFVAYYNLYFTTGLASAPLARIYDSQQAANMTMSVSGAAMNMTASAGEISDGAFDARPLSVPLDSFSQNPAAMQQQAPALLRDIFTGFHFASSEMRDFTMAFDLPRLGHVTGGAARLSVREFGAGQLQDVRIEGLAVSSPQFNFKLARFDLGGLDFSPLLSAVASPAGLNATQVLKAMPTVAHFQLAGMNLGLPGRPSLASLANFSVDNSGYRDGVPSQGSYSLDHLDLPVAALGKGSLFLAKLGYSQFNVSSHANLNFNPDNGELALRNADFTMDGGFRIAMSAALHSVPAPPYSAAIPNRASVSSAQIVFQNLGIVDRYFAPQIAKLGRPKAISAALAQDNQQITAQLGPTPFAGQLIAANAQFMQNPRNISIRMSSAAPILLTNWKTAPWVVSANQ